MTSDEITALANSLNNESFVELFNHFANRCHVFSGSLGRCGITSEVTWACLNGSTIQINTESSDLDSMADDPFFRVALEQYAKEGTE